MQQQKQQRVSRRQTLRALVEHTLFGSSTHPPLLDSIEVAAIPYPPATDPATRAAIQRLCSYLHATRDTTQYIMHQSTGPSWFSFLLSPKQCKIDHIDLYKNTELLKISERQELLDNASKVLTYFDRKFRNLAVMDVRFHIKASLHPEHLTILHNKRADFEGLLHISRMPERKASINESVRQAAMLVIRPPNARRNNTHRTTDANATTTAIAITPRS